MSRIFLRPLSVPIAIMAPPPLLIRHHCLSPHPHHYHTQPARPRNNNMIPLTLDQLNPAIGNVEYAVRGELAIRAEAHRVALKEAKEKGTASGLPFDRVIFSNIGNPQQKGLDQPPITFVRQLAALMEWPELERLAPGVFPNDVIQRARELREEIGSIGAYSHSQGVPLIRQHVAEFISNRDGYPSDPAQIFLTGGASAGVALLLSMLISDARSGVLIPIPQYPLYSATLAAHKGQAIGYHLDESSGWSTSVANVTAALEKATRDGVEPKALVVINPGNPTGALLDARTQEDLVRLCETHGLVLLADEVYQTNLHRPATHPFTSFKKVMCQLRSPVPLVSFHSTSKGVMGECGRRGGYFELHNFSEEVVGATYKMVSIGLCAPLQGQVAVDAMVRPPKVGEASYGVWKQETDGIGRALAQRTGLMAARLNSLRGVSCVDSPGALYLYPRVEIPAKAVEEAKRRGKAPDVFYALELLDETGICVVPGSGFEVKKKSGEEGEGEGKGAVEGHYRLTCLCPGVEEYVGKLERFHGKFMDEYGP